jgi:hypothetical protein
MGGRWGQLSIKLKRVCTTGTVRYTSVFNGVPLPGSQVADVTFFTLAPAYVGPRPPTLYCTC